MIKKLAYSLGERKGNKSKNVYLQANLHIDTRFCVYMSFHGTDTITPQKNLKINIKWSYTKNNLIEVIAKYFLGDPLLTQATQDSHR